jgi:predicted GNAT superfamily acetyltransferase
MIYDAAESDAKARGRLACEVNAEPPNEPSLAFHTSRGYVEAGRLAHASGKVTAMLVKELR